MKHTGYISGKISKTIYKNLLKYIDNIIMLPEFNLLPLPVVSHADMLMYKLNDSLLVHERYYQMYCDIFDGVKVTLTNEYISNTYPHDILLNALKFKDTLYCKSNYVSQYIKSDAKKIVNIKQGYVRCSTCIVNDEALITADCNIVKNIIATDVLLIKEGYIKLHGYDYGFIGGSSVKINDKILFFGDIFKHPDGDNIVRFCEKHDTKVISLSDEMLYDYGSMVII